MSSSASTLADAITQGWKAYQEQLVVIVRPLTAEQLAIRVAPDLRPVGEIIAHIIAGRAFWFFKVLNEGNDETAAMASWDDEGQSVRTAVEYAHGLEATWKAIEDAITHWTEADLAESIVLPWIGPNYPITRSFIVWHVIEHDLHHGGEVSHSLGFGGLEVKLPPPPPED